MVRRKIIDRYRQAVLSQHILACAWRLLWRTLCGSDACARWTMGRTLLNRFRRSSAAHSKCEEGSDDWTTVNLHNYTVCSVRVPPIACKPAATKPSLEHCVPVPQSTCPPAPIRLAPPSSLPASVGCGGGGGGGASDSSPQRSTPSASQLSASATSPPAGGASRARSGPRSRSGPRT